MGIIGTLTIWVVNAENWITPNPDWSKTVVRSDDTHDINLTIASWNLDGYYYRWFNKNTDNSTWDDTTSTYGEVHNNDRWWRDDILEIWFNPKPTNFDERQWPCPDWRHIPSRWERNALAIAWCKINESCDINSDIETLESSGLIRIYSESKELWTLFKNEFNMSDGFFWSSSPYQTPNESARDLDVWDWYINTDGTSDRDTNSRVRCFKNTYDAPVSQTHTLTFLDDWVKVRTWEVVDGKSWTWNISAPNGKRWYKFDYRYADGWDNTTGFDFNTPITGNIILHAHWTLVQSLPNWIVTNEDWSKTIVRWDTVLTVAWEDLWTYGWWTTSTDQSYSSDNNAWWWSGDNIENWYDNWKERYKRQWPCDTWWHVPSLGERSSLIEAWCNLTEGCDLRYNDIWIPEINNSIWKFNDELNFTWDQRYRPSSNDYKYYYVWIMPTSMLIQWQDTNTNNYAVRCFKNYITVPQIFEVTFIDEGRHIWSGDILSWDKIPSEIISQKNLTWLTKEWYTFSWWVISESNEKFDVENGIVTTWMILNAMRDKNQYTIRFDTDWWNNINSITAYYGDNITVPADPIKNWYRFVRREPEIPTTMPAENLTVKAIWEKTGSSGWWGWSSNWWSSSKSQTTNSLSSSKSETTNNLSLSIGNKNPDINERIEIIIDTDEKYTWIVDFTKMQYYTEWKWTNISMTSKNYVSDYSDEVEAWYTRFSSSDKWRIKISKFIKISQKGNYRIYVEDKDGNKDYVEFRVWNWENININNDTEEEVYISRSCKKYIIRYDEELGVFTSPNLLKKEYFINKDYFKRYIDSKNKQIEGCPTNKRNLVRYKDTSNRTDRYVAPNGKVYFIVWQQWNYFSNEFNYGLKVPTGFYTIQELKNHIMSHNPITPIVNKL